MVIVEPFPTPPTLVGHVLTQLRIVRAKELLAAGVKPSDIAPQVGLYDQSQLNRHFRRIVGTTPAQYARRV